QRETYTYEFGRFRLIGADRILLREGEPVALTPKVFDILLALVENGGRVVEKDDLMKRVWPNTFVEEGNLTQNISLLRKALGESPDGVQFIETVPRRGYRFVADTNKSWGENGSTVVPDTRSDPAVVVPIQDTTSQPARVKRTPFYALAAGLVVIGIIGVFYFTGRGTTAESSIGSIAVLPFVDESADPDAEYIND